MGLFKVNPSYFSTKVDILNSPTGVPSEDKWLEDLSRGIYGIKEVVEMENDKLEDCAEQL